MKEGLNEKLMTFFRIIKINLYTLLSKSVLSQGMLSIMLKCFNIFSLDMLINLMLKQRVYIESFSLYKTIKCSYVAFKRIYKFCTIASKNLYFEKQTLNCYPGLVLN